MRESFAKTSVEFLKDLGFLDERVMGSHGVYLDETDLGILAASGSSIVNSPTAEMKIADGTAHGCADALPRHTRGASAPTAPCGTTPPTCSGR